MLNRSIKKIIQLSALKNAYAFSAHEQPKPTKLPKVRDVTVSLYIRNKYGVVESVNAFVGESLLEAINRSKVHAFRQDNCNGFDFTYRPHYRPHDNDSMGPVCGSCRIVLEDNWFQRVHQETDGYNENEELLLNGALDVKSNTRLACCIPVEAWMEGLTCTVDVTPAEGEQSILI